MEKFLDVAATKPTSFIDIKVRPVYRLFSPTPYRLLLASMMLQSTGLLLSDDFRVSRTYVYLYYVRLYRPDQDNGVTTAATHNKLNVLPSADV